MTADRKSKTTSFEEQALAYFRDEVGDGHVQRLDGIERYSDLSGRLFWRWRLARMARRGKLHMIHGRNNFWASTRRLHHYGLPKSKDNGVHVAS